MWENLHDLLTQNVAGALEVVNVTALICQGNEANLRHVGRGEMPKGIWWNPLVSERICSYNTLPKFIWMLKTVSFEWKLTFQTPVWQGLC